VLGNTTRINSAGDPALTIPVLAILP